LGPVSGALSRRPGQLGPALGQPESNEGQESGMSRQPGRARDNRDDVGDNCPMSSDNGDACRGNWDVSGDDCPQSGDNGDRLRDNRSMCASTGIDPRTIGTGPGTMLPYTGQLGPIPGQLRRLRGLLAPRRGQLPRIRFRLGRIGSRMEWAWS